MVDSKGEFVDSASLARRCFQATVAMISIVTFFRLRLDPVSDFNQRSATYSFEAGVQTIRNQGKGMDNKNRQLAKNWRNRLESWGQRALLSIPLLSEIRLGKDRVMAFLRAWHYVSRAKIEGDYLEFGVMEGMSFKMSLRAATRCMPKSMTAPRFFAFDSFEGLPSPDGSRDGTIWEQGDCFSTKSTFEKNIRGASKAWQIEIVEGYYDKTLTEELKEERSMKKAAFIAIDCDLYDSTIQALRFATSLMQTGTVVYFDDWYFSHGDMSLGEAGACGDWLKENPGISLTDYGDVGIMGKCFIVQQSVHRCKKQADELPDQQAVQAC